MGTRKVRRKEIITLKYQINGLISKKVDKEYKPSQEDHESDIRRILEITFETYIIITSHNTPTEYKHPSKTAFSNTEL